ncbi:GatB/YqeY domain-containing protein [Caldicellulosiruptoraceae bacterium PP1]
MNLKEKLMEDLKTSMKDKDTIRKNAIGMVRAAILQYEKDNKVELDDKGVINIIAKEIKKRKDVLPEYIKSQRQDLIDELNKEIEILESYMPAKLSDEELRNIINKVITDTGAQSIRDIGKVMPIVMNQVSGRADGSKINQMVREILNS